MQWRAAREAATCRRKKGGLTLKLCWLEGCVTAWGNVKPASKKYRSWNKALRPSSHEQPCRSVLSACLSRGCQGWLNRHKNLFIRTDADTICICLFFLEVWCFTQTVYSLFSVHNICLWKEDSNTCNQHSQIIYMWEAPAGEHFSVGLPLYDNHGRIDLLEGRGQHFVGGPQLIYTEMSLWPISWLLVIFFFFWFLSKNIYFSGTNLSVVNICYLP